MAQQFCHAYSVAQMQEAERRAESEHGIPLARLMDNAGRLLARKALELLEHPGQTVVLLCGAGNNGGDGYVCAGALRRAGVPVRVIGLGRERLRADSLAGAAAAAFEREGGSILPPRQPFAQQLEGAALVVDALFGTGLKRPLEGDAAALVEAVNASGCAVLSCDLPSGIEADSGAVLGRAVKAQHTLVLGLPKQACLLSPGCHHFGRQTLGDIGLPQSLAEGYSPTLTAFTEEEFYALLPPRRPDGHKYQFGNLLLVCGQEGYTGSAALCAQAALRAGAGMVQLAVPRCIYPILAAKLDEPCVHPVADNGTGLAREALPRLLELAGRATALAFGPGIGLSADNSHLLRGLIEGTDIPLVLDADGLNTLSRDLAVLQPPHTPAVLTPHHGELSRLLQAAGLPQDNPLSGAQQLAERLQATVVVKGSHTVVLSPGGRRNVILQGNAGMAKAGSGDLLTGIICALLGRGLPAHEAACCGVWLHASAGDLAAERLGQYAMNPSDSLAAMPQLLKPIDG